MTGDELVAEAAEAAAGGPAGCGPAVRVFFGRAAEVRRPDDVALLDETELMRANRFMTEELAAHFTASHAAMRRLLGEWMAVDPREIRYGRRRCPRCASGEHGAPRVVAPAPAPHHSLSHTGPVWMLACSDDRVVGADVEGARPAAVDGLIRFALSPGEREVVEAVPAEGRLHLLLRCWVRKEAVLKGIGVGIAGSMSALEVAPVSADPVLVDADLEFGRSSWWVTSVLDGPQWYAAVAVEADGPGSDEPPALEVTDLGSRTGGLSGS